ncbi:MAG: hypothetical protein J0M08_10280 [Bacteroidetes bacterium]|nr:hypothetical protein [Bacteroidota bacterium]
MFRKSLHIIFGLVVFFALVFSATATYAQEFNLEIGGKVEKDGKRLEGAKIKLYQGATVAQEFTTSENGKFSFKLKGNVDYTIVITKKGLITKKFTVTTKNVPDRRAMFGFGGFEFTVSLFEMLPNIDYSVLDNPIAKISYNTEEEEFSFDKIYTESMLDALKQLKALEEQAKKEAANIANAQQEIDEKYTATILKADNAFKTKNYDEAKKLYIEAIAIKQGEKYPSEKIIEIDKLLAEQQNKALAEQNYKSLIVKGDKAFADKEYSSAKIAYSEALSIKEEKYPKDKIKEIETILENLSKKNDVSEQYNNLIAKADEAFKKNEYAAAKTSYQEASQLKSYEKYPKDKILEIDRITKDLKKNKDVDEEYTKLLSTADNTLKEKDFALAKTTYKKALAIKPTEEYPKNKIAEIDLLIASQVKSKETDDAYFAIMNKANEEMKKNNYEDAKKLYEDALKIKPIEELPQNKIAELNKLISDLNAEKNITIKYQQTIIKADKAFNAKDYELAKNTYNDALAIKSTEAYPKNKIIEIDRILADKLKLQEQNTKYAEIIDLANTSFDKKEYAIAKQLYNSALTIKPAEKYPTDRIAEIEAIFAAIEKEKEVEKRYQLLIATGDKLLKEKDYPKAIVAYTDAQAIKEKEEYPKNKIAEIEKIIAEREAAKELEKKYYNTILKADNSFAEQSYTNAIQLYNEALELKRAEKYPKDKIVEIEKILAEQEKQRKQKEIDDAYKAQITQANAAFEAKKYSEAKSFYLSALDIKTTELFPKQRIDDIDKIVAEIALQKELEERYQNALTKANNQLEGRNYQTAISHYNEALAIKPNEKYPKDKIIEINKILDAIERIKEINKKYTDLLTKADNYFKEKEYKIARVTYAEAANNKPSENYPKEKISEIDLLLKTIPPTPITTNTISPQDSKADFKKQLLAKYGQGVTEEESQEGTSKVIKRVVVKGDNVNIYLKKMWNWGGVYYFKDGVPITQQIFETETR